MRAIVGVQIVKSGTVTVLGAAGRLARRCGATVGYVTQAPSVYADLTVRENARYFAALLRPRRAAEADQAIADVGLADAAGQLVGNLSGGQRSRASLACALVGAPRAAGPRRADRRPGPGAARRPVGAVPRAGRGRHDAAGLQPRDGRGRPLRPAAADPRGPADRRRHPGRGPRRRRHRRPRGGVPAPDPASARRWRHEPADHRLATDRAHPAPAAARPAHRRAAGGGAGAAAGAALLHVRRTRRRRPSTGSP